MTKVCCYCHPHHVIGEAPGPEGVITHGLCTWAYIKETAKFYLRVFWGWTVAFSIAAVALFMALAAAHILISIGLFLFR